MAPAPAAASTSELRFLAKGSALNYLAVGAGIHPLEWPLLYVLFPVLVFGVIPDEATAALFRSNLLVQLCVFLSIVQLPAFYTNRMSYVDIGWPCGLVAMGCTTLTRGEGWWVRRWVVCALLLMHGGRMFIGALIQFYPYRFAKDLQRYRFARWRWTEQDGMPATGIPWGYKIQHDTMQQCFANAVLLAIPVLFPGSNTKPELSPVEVCGWTIWMFGWLFENAADWQKLKFKAAVRTQRRALQMSIENSSPLPPSTSKNNQSKSRTEHKESDRVQSELRKLNSATLGYTPWDGPEYWLWTLCRHPNYFGEWCCWLGLVIASIPSLLQLFPDTNEGAEMFRYFALALFYVLRLFYDCLVHWTGAGPAEFYSYQKRAAYGKYQQTTRCFWPLPLPEGPLICHYRTEGWPAAHLSSAERRVKSS